MSSSKSSSVPKPPLNFSETLTIPKDAKLLGTHSITIQAETVIHPRAKLDSSYGSIFIGRRCVIHERTEIGQKPESTDNVRHGGVSFGDYVVIEVGSIITAGGTEIGDGTVIQVGSNIGCGAKIGKNCTITSRSVISAGQVIPDNMVAYSHGKLRADRRCIVEARKTALVKQINVSRKMIPNALNDIVKTKA